jgi:NAD(P)-dependent dehydrogenase (short-subunit alcohol dehydrogenase family)
VLDTNLNVPFFTVQRFSEHINSSGRIIFIGALMGQFPHAMSISYGVSKAAVHFLTSSLVKVFSDEMGITVNCVAPGFVDTPWQTNKAPDHRKRIEDKIALHRFAKPEEVAQLCLSVIENDYINGSVINIDGGYSYK